MTDKVKSLNIDLPAEVVEGNYCNMTIVMHSPNEFVLDFVRMVPNKESHRVQSRIILTPSNAKRLLASLHDNVGRYEATYGEIEIPKPLNEEPTIVLPTIQKGDA